MNTRTLPDLAKHLLSTLTVLTLLAACGGGGDNTPSSAGPSDTATGRLRAMAVASGSVATSLSVPIAPIEDPLMQNLAIPADAATRGMWGGTKAWPMNGLHAALLPDGRVLTYGTPKNTPDTQNGRTDDLWTPSLGFTDAAHQSTYNANYLDSFCNTAAWLADGRLMLSGGNSPVNSAFFSPSASSRANDLFALADQRWYATLLPLPDGRMVMLGGMDPYQEGMVDNPETAIANGTVSMTPEIYKPGTGWTSLGGARSRDAFGPDYLRASYPRAWVAPNGKIFGISAETLWSLDVHANTGTGAITVLGKFKTPASTTAPVNVGATSSAVMYAPGKILQVGGNGYFNGDGYPASNKASLIDINGATPVVTETAAMALPRRYVNTVVLPDGKVLATGGTKLGNNGGADAVYAAEIWNPATGTWTTGASAAQIRVYHSATLLLPNGTVLSTGGGAPGPVNNLNAEVYYPPYLFTTVGGAAQLAPRPALIGISAKSFNAGGTVVLQMSDSTAMARLVLIANGTVTHSFNNGQRFIELAFTQSGDMLTATLPASANVVPPGYYQLAVLNANGVPSVATTVAIGMSVKSAAETPALAVGSSYALSTLTPANYAMATDATGLGVIVPAATADTAPANAQFTVRAGLADAACVSLESTAQPGKFMRHANYRLQLGANDGSALFANDATFCREPGLAGSGLTLRSKNFPGYVVHHRNGQLWLDTQASDTDFANTASFLPRAPAGGTALPPLASTAIAATAIGSGATASYSVSSLEAEGLSFAWDFGDGGSSAYSDSGSVNHAYNAPGLYTVTLTARTADGRTASKVFVQAVYGVRTGNTPRASSALLLEPRGTGAARLWVVNPDNDTVSVFDTSAGGKLKEIATGAAPRTVALAADGSVWVSNRDSASISVINPGTLAVSNTIKLPRASQPWGLVIAPDGYAYISLSATGQVLKLNGSTGTTVATLSVGNSPRHLSVSADSATVLVSRFITAPMVGEGTATIDTNSGGGEVWMVNAGDLTLRQTSRLAYSNKADTETTGSGLPNYLGAAAISPDGKTAWVPSKQDNVTRGMQRNGQGLNFQNTVRAISSRITLATGVEDSAMRADHDNSSLASAATFDPTGTYLFVALETSREVAVLDAAKGSQLFRINVGLAPQGLAVSADGQRLYAHNFMGRNVSVVNLGPLVNNGELASTLAATWTSVGTEKLSATVLLGKQLFHDARDTRLARDAYMSCASCHNDGEHDGRTWDLSNHNEGLRNTLSLRGHAGMGQGLLHWSGNFDEVQDFEKQIRDLAGGTGLMSDAAYNTGTRNQPMGTAKAGVSADLDALAAYVTSLSTFDSSPLRPAAGTLSAAALAGKAVFANAACAACHGGPAFTSSALSGGMLSIGTLKASSGNRLGAALTGLDVPTLRGLWATAPYLHDGSAPTLAAAVQAHAGNTVTSTELGNLVAYLQQIDGDEAAPPDPLGDGVYRLLNKNSGMALSITNASTSNSATANQLPWAGTNNQRWKLINLGSGKYQLTAQHSAKRLEVGGCSTAEGGTVQQYTATTSRCQTWLLTAVGDGSYRVINSNSNKVIEVTGSSTTSGAKVKQRTWAGTNNQKWTIAPVSSHYIAAGNYRLTPSHSGKALDVAGVAVASGANVTQWAWLAGANQKWAITASADGFYELSPTHAAGMRLEVAAGGLLNAHNVQQGWASGTAAQRWSFEVQADGSHRLVNRNSGLSLEVAGASTADGANVQQGLWSGAANQKWKLVKQ